ncbi:MAG: hypothetical protein DMF61_05405 [Blastocatellia bacterium AA13]|nr:MAG: hypothetical protein DMF61_05405 [Blastocatellia bacterium AA13]
MGEIVRVSPRVAEYVNFFSGGFKTMSTQQPNHFDLHGHGTHIVYDTTSFTGKPQFTYTTGGHSQSFTGDEIRTQDSEIGTLVTVTIFKTVDTGSTTLTLLVPHVNLVNNKSHIKTEGIITVHHFFASNPGLIKGQLETYQTIALQGTAALLEF